jgi:hypothetical protein
MDKQRNAAGETAKTKPAWGVVAVIGFVVACTMGESLAMAAIGAAMLGLGAWLGGYMTEDAGRGTARHETGTKAGERRAA